MIELSNLTFGYSKKSLLFKNLNLKLEAGHIYGLLGKNGAGKSTLLKNLVGLVYPNEGSCLVNGYNASDRLPSFLQELFFIPEELYLPDATVIKYMENTAHFYPRFNRDQFFKILNEFEVPDNSMFKSLSLGQQKKAMIAFGLATNTTLVIMDEPTNGLDIPSKAQFRKIIASALTDERCIIISTHQVRDLENLIDSLIVLHEQEVLLNLSLDQISEKIRFSTAAQAEPDWILYQADGIGVNTISAYPDLESGKVDIELLFNGLILSNHALIEALK
ncbi:MAG: ABC transporter ATP-binding protein [Candidatus Pedobacter colombiensis]|uniref:ABC transporter ATP-binding protein n=1 Tax=Candidatus Pedobacter colombiensis TaxID=3121371 RepID=A0AAJ6B5N2_9SPHI|nr:ABC transporter ATP-binding protein [Pedobacter sp.]WEK18315.1 MAG: ABC transporter ATP-binding protein [Pedobacter sp.]